MRNKRVGSAFTNKNAVKLFIAIFVSVVSIFALVYLVQQPLFQAPSQAASK